MYSNVEINVALYMNMYVSVSESVLVAVSLYTRD